MTLTLHVPRLSIVCPATTEVFVKGKVKTSVCGSVTMSFCLTTSGSVLAHWKRRATVKVPRGAPTTLAQTVSPKLNDVFGVVQSEAKVWIVSSIVTGNATREAKAEGDEMFCLIVAARLAIEDGCSVRNG